MACGTGSYFIAVIGSVIITIVAYILFKTNYGSIYKSEFILQFRYEKGQEKVPIYNDILKKYCKYSTLLNSEPSGDNKDLKLTFDIILKEETNIDNFILDISKSKGISETSIAATKNDIDY